MRPSRLGAHEFCHRQGRFCGRYLARGASLLLGAGALALAACKQRRLAAGLGSAALAWLLVEEHSRNTAENARLTQELQQPRSIRMSTHRAHNIAILP